MTLLNPHEGSLGNTASALKERRTQLLAGRQGCREGTKS